MIKLIIEDEGYIWEIPMEKIAENYANHYSNLGKPEWEEEYDYIMQCPDEGLDWYMGDMDFEDVEDVAVLVKVPELLTRPSRNAISNLKE